MANAADLGAKGAAAEPDCGAGAAATTGTRRSLAGYGPNEDKRGDKPVLRWIREELTLTQRSELGQAMRDQLQEKGVGVCATEYGKQLGRGLFEFRLRRSVEQVGERILLRVFCHAHGSKVVLLLGGYDKGADPSPRRQGDEIAVARRRLAEWQRRRT